MKILTNAALMEQFFGIIRKTHIPSKPNNISSDAKLLLWQMSPGVCHLVRFACNETVVSLWSFCSEQSSTYSYLWRPDKILKHTARWFHGKNVVHWEARYASIDINCRKAPLWSKWDSHIPCAVNLSNDLWYIIVTLIHSNYLSHSKVLGIRNRSKRWYHCLNWDISY